MEVEQINCTGRDRLFITKNNPYKFNLETAELLLIRPISTLWIKQTPKFRCNHSIRNLVIRFNPSCINHSSSFKPVTIISRLMQLQSCRITPYILPSLNPIRTNLCLISITLFTICLGLVDQPQPIICQCSNLVIAN